VDTLHSGVSSKAPLTFSVMVKRENAITVDIVKAIVIRNYIKLGEHVKKMK